MKINDFFGIATFWVRRAQEYKFVGRLQRKRKLQYYISTKTSQNKIKISKGTELQLKYAANTNH